MQYSASLSIAIVYANFRSQVFEVSETEKMIKVPCVCKTSSLISALVYLHLDECTSLSIHILPSEMINITFKIEGEICVNCYLTSHGVPWMVRNAL